MHRVFAAVILLITSCISDERQDKESVIGEEAFVTGAYLDRLVLPESDQRAGRRGVALRLNSDPPSAFPTLSYALFRIKDDTASWELHLASLGYTPIALSHDASWDKVFKIRNRDIVPLGEEFYRFTFTENDHSVTVERVTEALAKRFTLCDDCARLWTNSFEPRLMAEVIGKGRFSDVVRFDEFRPGDDSVVITLLPTVSANGPLPKLIWERQTHTLKTGDVWKARSHTYQILSVVDPQVIPEGNLVGWMELRLRDRTTNDDSSSTPHAN